MHWGIWLSNSLAILLMAGALTYLGLNALLLIECLLAWFPVTADAKLGDQAQPASFTVLVPAHNEAGVIEKTLQRLTEEVETPEQIWVIADNCQDATADLARQAGVTVLERTDTSRRGKGYALDFGLKALAEQAPNIPDVVVMLDADCWVSSGTIARIATKASAQGRPVQAIYLMEQAPNPSLRDRVSAFAWTVKNRVRAAGLSRLGAPILLTGSGMAFPWQSLQAIDLASSHLVEDMKLGIDLAIAGHNPILALDSQVWGMLPNDPEAAKSQRTRWEQGHLQVLRTYVLRLWGQAIRQLRPGLFGLGLDLAVPPLALWSLLGLLLTVITALGAWLGGSLRPLQIQLIADGGLLISIMISWLAWGRDLLSLPQLASIPLYILWKIPIYLKALLRPETKWVRTKRNP